MLSIYSINSQILSVRNIFEIKMLLPVPFLITQKGNGPLCFLKWANGPCPETS